MSESTFRKIMFPFTIEVDPMEKLLLLNFEKDPDSIYFGFEPQVFKDSITGVKHLIIGWRKDKKVDVYHQKSLNPDPSKYSITGAGLNKIIPVDMEKAFYEVNDFGAQVHYKFMDLLGRSVEIEVNENNSKRRKPFGILAPMGDAASGPTSFPMVLLHDFYFIRKKDTVYKILIDNKNHKLDELPISMDGQKMTFARYSSKPLIAAFNPEYNGLFEPLNVRIDQNTYEKDNYIYELEWNNQTAKIKSLSVKNNIHMLKMKFEPSFPCLNSIDTNTNYEGEFVISGHESVGNISGEYSIHLKNKSVIVSVVPSKGWKPKTTKLSTWFLFSVAKVFKKWPTTYKWDCNLKKNSEDLWHMQSKWCRTGKILKD